MTVAPRGVTLRDFTIFQLKLVMEGFKDLIFFNLSMGAIVLDYVAGRGRRPRLFYSVVRASKRFDAWLNLHGAVERLEASDTEEGLLDAGEAGSDRLIREIERLARGDDGPREERMGPSPDSE